MPPAMTGWGQLSPFLLAILKEPLSLRLAGLASMDTSTYFDADAYWRAGNCPWTFFAFPRVLADDAGLPSDDDAKRLLAALRDRGIPVGTWVNAFVEDTAYFACPKEAIGCVNDALIALEELGEFEKGFCAKRTEYLFSRAGKSTKPDALADDGREPGSS